ncbi:MAG: thioesterase family protein [Pseudomonadota bacterium]
MQVRTPPGRRRDYGFFVPLQTRWMDNDLYGHVNNVVYYSYFDTLIAEFLVNEGGFDPFDAEVIGYAVETGCRFHSGLRYPDRVVGGLRIGHLGKSSVRYEIGIFHEAADDAAAEGHFIHVFVERATERPVAIPAALRAAMVELQAVTDAAG